MEMSFMTLDPQLGAELGARLPGCSRGLNGGEGRQAFLFLRWKSWFLASGGADSFQPHRWCTFSFLV